MTNQPLQDELARLSRERDTIELEVEAASSRLRAAGVGMDKPLIDAEVKIHWSLKREIDRTATKKTKETNSTSCQLTFTLSGLPAPQPRPRRHPCRPPPGHHAHE